MVCLKDWKTESVCPAGPQRAGFLSGRKALFLLDKKGAPLWIRNQRAGTQKSPEGNRTAAERE